jgi:3-methyl-2-oxobutanoate hydroxymethyltransferase
MGGYRVQGRGEEAATRIIEQASALQKAGAFSIVLEGVPAELGTRITEHLHVPTIGIGAGPGCDAQVLVVTDLLGLSEGKLPKFAKAYTNLREEIAQAASTFAREVQTGTFPDPEHSYE